MAEYISNLQRKLNVGIESYTNNELVLYVIGNTNITGVVTSQNGFVGNLTGISSSSYKLQNPRTFQITGDIVAAPQTFDGTQNISFASSIQPNVVGLGTHTYGDYVKNISGTLGEIEVINGTGEGSSPVVGLPDDVFVTSNLQVGNNVQINSNLNVTGNITVGGTAAYLIVNDLRIKDKDIVLGIVTDSYGNDLSTDISANHGGISVASTEGNPLVSLKIAGINSLPDTYKQIMWVAKDTMGPGTTDAWLSNYAIGIGSTQVPVGTYLAVGNVQITNNSIKSNSADINYLNAGISTINSLNVNGVSTLGTVQVYSGIITATTGIVTYYGDGSKLIGVNAFNVVDQQLTSNPVYPTFANNSGVTSVGIASTQVAYIPSIGNLGIGTTNPTSKIHIVGDGLFTGIVTAQKFVGEINASNISGIVAYASTAGIATNLKGGQIGAVPYQSNINSTNFIIPGTPGHVYITGGPGVPPYWGPVSAAAGAFGGITIQEDGVVVGTAGSVTTVNFGIGVSVIATTGANGIATVSVPAQTYVNNSGIATNVIGGIGSITQLQVTGISTFVNGPVFIGSASTTGVTSQRLQVTGGAYISDNIGIGTTNPSVKLQVIGSSVITGISTIANFSMTPVGSGSTIGGIGVTYYGDGSKLTGVVGTQVVTQTATSTPVYPTFANATGVSSIGISTTQFVFIPNSGNVGLGTTNPTSKLTIIGDVLITGITTSTDFNSSSDKNLKTNIKTISNPIEKIMKINGVNFNWKDTNKKSAGVIAQEVMEIMPELTSGNPLTLNYNGLIGLLIEAVKDQQNQIDLLKKQINK